MNKIKVLHIITRLDKGGSAENTILTAALLDKNKYDVSLACGSAYELGESRVGEVKDCILIPELSREISPVKDLKAFCKIFRLIRRKRFDIVHTHTSKAGVLGRIAAKLAGVPIIIHTPHGHIFYGYYGRLKSAIFILIERITALFTDRIITLTEIGKREYLIQRIGNEHKLVVIHSGVDPEVFFKLKVDIQEKKKELGLPDNSIVIGNIARLSPVKAQCYLLEAARIVLDKIKNIVFLIVGDGPLRKELEAQADMLGITRNVYFTGIRYDIPEILKIVDIFALIPLNEGMGRIIVEAMLSEKPVIATKVGGVPEVVVDGRTGFLVTPANAEETADRIMVLLKNPELRKQMGMLGKERAVTKFSLAEMIRKIDSLYQELIHEKNI